MLRENVTALALSALALAAQSLAPLLSGRVVLDDGDPGVSVRVQRVCGVAVTGDAITDSRGRFAIGFGHSNVLPALDRTETPRGGGFSGCELRASLAGYQPRVVALETAGGGGDLGVIVLNRANASPAMTVSTTTLLAALESMVRYFAVALAKRGITVNAISPGWTENSVLNSFPDQVQDLIRNWHKRGWTPMGRLGTPEDIGDVVTLFCCEQARWITGQIIYADGGASLMTPEYHRKYSSGKRQEQSLREAS